MKEFFLPLREHLPAGLRHQEEARPGEPGLALAENLRPTLGGLRAAYSPAAPLEGQVWPYPQLFKTYRGSLLAGATAWHSYSAGVATPLCTGLAAGHTWSIADFMDYLLATNGTAKVYRNPATGAWGVNGDATVPLAGALCTFNGQGLAGDLPSSWYGAGHNWVAWSQIGAISFVPDKKNTAGYRPMPWPGQVLAMRQLGQHVMVYGDNGVGDLFPASSPAPTFGFREMPFSGVAGRLALAGDDTVHYFVDCLGNLYRLTDNHEITYLGYREFLQPLILGGISLSMCRLAGGEEVIISGADRHYVYRQASKSLAGPCWQPSSGALVQAGQMIMVGPGAEAPAKATVVTNPLDMGKRGLKTVEWVEVEGSGLSGLEVALDYRYSTDSDWSRTSWVPAGPEGNARLALAALEFRVCARCDLDASLLLSQINVRWKASDRRFSRGSEAINWGQGSPQGA